ncbi:MAG TPA: hypothetical protein VJ600_10295 [Holophagaceae bacterium]|nr:hypothetical protein [Holophagaceae bacterium]
MEGLRQDTRQVVAQLERQVARLRTGLWCMSLLLLGAIGFLGWHHLHPKAAPKASTLRVQGLEVEDERGTARVVLGAQGLRILDPQGRERGGLLVRDDGASVLLLEDRQGVPAFTATGGEEGATLALRNTKKKDALILSTAQGSTLQLRKDDRLILKQPYDAQELK